MRLARLGFLILLAGGVACRSAKTVPENGAILLHVKCTAGTPVPDALRIWVYDDQGRLWDGVRIPADGPLVATEKQELGTILIQPGVTAGRLRIHVRGFLGEERILDGTLTVDPAAAGDRTFDLTLDSSERPDDDRDGVPDSVDNCWRVPNPEQGACPDVAPDASGDGMAGAPDGAVVPEVMRDGGGTDSAGGGDVKPTDADRGPEPADASPELGDGPGPNAPDAAPDRPPFAAETGDGSADRPGLADVADTLLDRPGQGAEVADAAAERGSDGPACTADGGCATKSQGTACASKDECSSGFCADGVCCTNACLGPCRSCNQPSGNGICQGYATGSDPEHECSSGATCNGVGACGSLVNPNLANGQLCTAGSQCKSGACVDGVCCDSKCDQPCQTCGTGTCQSVKRADDVPECSGAKTCNPAGKCVDRAV